MGRLYWQRFLEKEQWFYTRGKRRYTISGRRSLVELQAVIFSFLTSATLPLLTCNTGAIQLAIQPVMSVTHAHTDKFTLTTHTHTHKTHTSVIRFRRTARFLYDKTEIENIVKQLRTVLIVHRSTNLTKKKMSTE